MPPPSPPPPPPSPDPYPLIVKSLLTAALIVVIVLAAAQLIDLLMLVFGAVVVGVLIRALADAVERVTPLSRTGSFYAALLLIVLAMVGFGALLGGQVSRQFSSVVDTVPAVWRQLKAWVATMPGGPWIIASAEGFTIGSERVFPAVRDVLASVATVLADLVVLLFGAVFIAADPALYRRGMVLLVPKAHRPLADQALRDAATALKLWMMGQMVSMAVVGLLTGLGLWLVGAPAPLALAVIMGVAEIIPWLGPWLGGVPVVIMALGDGPETALWAIVVVVAVQQAEGAIVTPLVQKRAVLLPPAVTVFGVIAGGLLFGPAGLLFAAPLLVVAFVLIKRLYVEGALDTPTDIPGRDDR